MIWENTPQQYLVGKKIKAVYVGDYMLAFDIGDGYEVFDVYGDCCSESWWSDINGVANIIGKTVKSVEDNEEGEKQYDLDDGRCRQDYDSVYSFSLVTESGEKADFYYRNSSNGYYGGWIQYRDKFESLPSADDKKNLWGDELSRDINPVLVENNWKSQPIGVE